MDRAKLAKEYSGKGYNCAQAVACSFSDVIGLPPEKVAGLLGGFGGGLRTGEVCGVITGAALVLGAKWPLDDPSDSERKAFISEKVMLLQKEFADRFGAVRCEVLKPMDPAPEKSPASQRLGVEKTCGIYIVAAVEILEKMLEL